MKIVVVSGGFDPLHSGHISYLNSAKAHGDKLIVGVNSDEWLIRKKGRAFMSLFERTRILQHIREVDHVVEFDDSDGSSKHLLQIVKQTWPNDEIIFANGGDRTQDNIPEMSVEGVKFVFAVGGGNKMNSSSWILDEWKSPKTERPWGHYRVLYESENTKVKELTVNPGQSLSMQKHEFRNEHWHVVEGTGVLYEERKSSNDTITLYKHNQVTIPCGVWHRLSNESNDLLKIVEIQYGQKCQEEDIERR